MRFLVARTVTFTVCPVVEVIEVRYDRDEYDFAIDMELKRRNLTKGDPNVVVIAIPRDLYVLKSRISKKRRKND